VVDPRVESARVQELVDEGEVAVVDEEHVAADEVRDLAFARSHGCPVKGGGWKLTPQCEAGASAAR
jgi:hypothetical protein